MNLKMLWEPEFQSTVRHVEGFVDLEALGQHQGGRKSCLRRYWLHSCGEMPALGSL